MRRTQKWIGYSKVHLLFRSTARDVVHSGNGMVETIPIVVPQDSAHKNAIRAVSKDRAARFRFGEKFLSKVSPTARESCALCV